MRLPGEVLDRVRGAVVLAALTTACGNGSPPEPPTATTTTAPEIAVAPPEPPDPVPYASADEAERLSRVDREELATLDVHTARVNALAAERRAQAQHVWLRELTSRGCMACGRG